MLIQKQQIKLKIQQINFTENIEKNTLTFFITEEVKETALDFSKGPVKLLWFFEK